MHTPSSKSTVQLRIEQYVIEPVKRIAYVLLWGLVTGYLTLWLIIFLETIILHFSHIWAMSFPTSIGRFWGTPIALSLACVVVLCRANVYTIKQTRQAYQELCAWVVSIVFFQRLALFWRYVRKMLSSSQFLVVIKSIKSESEIVPKIETMLSEVLWSSEKAENHRTETQPGGQLPAVSALPEEQVGSSIFGTVLISCQIRVVGPTGKEKVVDLQHSGALPLWLYLIARTEASSVADILRDVYGYNGWVENKTGQMEDPKARLLSRFYYYCRSLRNEIRKACAEVGHPETHVLLSEKRHGTTYWRLSDIQIEDLAHLEACRTSLSGLKEIHSDEAAYRADTLAACECISEDGANLPGLLNVYKKMSDTNWRPRKPYWTDTEYTLVSQARNRLRLIQPNASWYEPWFHRLLKEAINTYSDALQYLATQAHTEVEQTVNQEARWRLWCREEYFWSKYALSCAHMADEFPEEQETWITAGELALQKALSCTLLLRDPVFNATYTYNDFKQLVGGWEPSAETVGFWRQALAQEKEGENDDIPDLFWGDRYSESLTILKRWNAGS